MKTRFSTFRSLLFKLLFCFHIFGLQCLSEKVSAAPQDTLSYINGIYFGESQANYKSEPFWGHVLITINSNLITGVDFIVRDSSLHEVVDSMYGVNHYSSIPDYMQQCVNEDHAIKIYPLQLIEKQNIDDIDAITGATWSYNIFVASTRKALENAITTSGNSESASDENRMLIRPNPFGNRLNLEYILESPAHIHLDLIDMEGRVAKQIADGDQPAGLYEAEWENDLSKGYYVLLLRLDDRIISQVLMKSE